MMEGVIFEEPLDLSVRILLSEFLLENEKDVTDALLVIFEKHNELRTAVHRRKAEEAKVIFLIHYHEDFSKMFELMRGMQSRILYKEQLPEFIVEELDKKSVEAEITTKFWPSSWVTHIELKPHSVANIEADLQKLYFVPNLERLSVNLSAVLREPGLPLLIGSGIQLKNLRSLCIYNGRQYYLPSTLQFCNTLEELDLNGNSFRYLPYWLTRLKNLKRLCRLNNCLELEVCSYSHIEKCTVQVGVSKEPDGNKKLLSANSLFNISAAVVLVEYPQLILCKDDKCCNLPRDVLNELSALATNLRFCDRCNQGFFSSNYIAVRKTFKDFIGYKNIPFEAVCCSDLCADKVWKEWESFAKKNETDDETETSFYVEGSVERMQRLWHHRQKRLRNENYHRIFRSVFCCCC